MSTSVAEVVATLRLDTAEAQRELRAALTAGGAQLGERVGSLIAGGIRDTIGDGVAAEVQSTLAEASTGARSKGAETGRQYASGVEGTIGEGYVEKVKTALGSAGARATSEGRQAGNKYATGVHTRIGTGYTAHVRSALKRAGSFAHTEGRLAGHRFATGVTSRLSTGIVAHMRTTFARALPLAHSSGVSSGRRFVAGVRLQSLVSRLRSAFHSAVPAAASAANAARARFLSALRSLGSGVRSILTRPFRSAGGESGQGFGASFLAAGKLKVLAAAAALAGAATASFSAFIARSNVGGSIAARVGANSRNVGALGNTAARLYVGGFGDSIETVGDTIATVMESANLTPLGESVGAVSRAVITAGNVTGESADRIIQAAQNLVRNGLARNVSDAIDLIVTAQQQGLNAQGDLLDTTNEYASQFAKLGISGPKAMAMIQAGLRGGARDSDYLADAIKEFSIRAIDGSATTSAAFQALGLDVASTSAAFSAGGSTANAAFTEVFNRLSRISDPLQRSQIAVSLFGTKAEDLGSSLFAMANASTAAFDNISGATRRAGNLIHMGPGAAFERLKRTAYVTGGAIVARLFTLGDRASGALLRWWRTPGVQRWAASVGQSLSQAGSAIASTTSTVVRNFASWWQSEGTQRWIGRILSAVRSVGGGIASTVRTVLPYAQRLIGTLGSVLGPVITKLTQSIRSNALPVLAAMRKEWEKNKDKIMPVVKILAKVAGVVGLVIGLLPPLVAAFAAVAAGIAALGLVALISKMARVAMSIRAFARDVRSTIGNLFRKDIPKALASIYPAMRSLVTFFARKGTELVNALRTLPSRLSALMRTAFNSLRTAAVERWGVFASWMATRVTAVLSYFRTLPGRLLGIGRTAFTALRTGAVERWNALAAWLATRVATVVRYFSALPGRLMAAGRTAFTALRTGAIERWNVFTAWLSTRAVQASNYFSSLPARLRAWAVSAFRSLREGAIERWNVFTSWVSGLAGTVVGWLNSSVNLGARLWDWIAGAWQNIREGALSRWYTFTAWVSGIPGTVVTYLNSVTNLSSALWNWANNVWQSIKDGALSRWNAFIDWVRGLPGAIIDALPGVSLAGFGSSVIESLIDRLKDKLPWPDVTRSLNARISALNASLIPITPTLAFAGGLPTRGKESSSRGVPTVAATGALRPVVFNVTINSAGSRPGIDDMARVKAMLSGLVA